MDEKVTVGKKFELLKKRFSDARACEDYSIRDKKLLSDAILAVDYVKSFFEGTSHLPPLEESAATTWGKTFDNLRRAFSDIEDAERMLDEDCANVLELALIDGSNDDDDDERERERIRLPGDEDVPGFDLTSGNDMSDFGEAYVGTLTAADEAEDEEQFVDELEMGLEM